jgi:2'-5' RNA ligase
MRLFVALAIPDEVRIRIAKLIGELRKADSSPRWVAAKNLHITLKFIGEASEAILPQINEALEALPAAPHFDFELRSLGYFPNARWPDVLWAGMNAPPALNRLALNIESALERERVARSAKPFAPHLTLARFRNGQCAVSLKNAIERANSDSFGVVRAAEFHLINSTLKPAGAEYTTVRSFALAGDAGRG